MRPLKPIELSLLIALLEGPGHGYALAQRIEDETDGRSRVLPGNLYAVIARLQKKGWIKEQAANRALGPQRRSFALTPSGRERTASETRALERQLQLAQQRLEKAGGP